MSTPRIVLFASIALLSACHGASHPGGADAAPDVDMTGTVDLGFQPATHAAFAPIPSGGGAVLSNVKLVSVSYDGFPQEDTMKSFGDWLVTSSYYTGIGAEYGVQAGTHQLVHLAEAAPDAISSADIGPKLAQLVDAGTLPAPTPETLYLLYTPPNAVVDGSTSCTKLAGTFALAYHTYQPYKAGAFAYAVVSSCPSITLEALEFGASHEIIEAATDPYGDTFIYPDSDPWFTLGSEIADNCTGAVLADGHKVSRVWSNAAITAGNVDPCAPDAPYFNVDAQPERATVAAGETASFTLTGWSTMPVPDYYVIIGPGISNGSVSTVSPTTTLDVAKLNNGEVGHATITAPANAKSGTSYALRLCGTSRPAGTDYFCRPITIDIE